MICPHCGAQLTDGTRFCSQCGAQIPAAPQQPAPYYPPQGAFWQQTQPVYPPYAQPYPQVQQKKNKGLLIALLIAGFLVLGIVVLVVVNGGSFTTANLTQVKTAANVDPFTYEPVDPTDMFSVDSPVIYVTMRVNNAPSNTKITARWVYADQEIEILKKDYYTTEMTENVAFNLEQPDDGFPSGSYRVELSVDGKKKQSVNFTVE